MGKTLKEMTDAELRVLILRRAEMERTAQDIETAQEARAELEAAKDELASRYSMGNAGQEGVVK